MNPSLDDLLARHRRELIPFVQRHGGLALRYEAVDDLIQGVHVRALERRGDFTYAGEKPFFAWLHGLARSHLTDRARYWSALKRRPASLLRLTGSRVSGSDPGAAAEPAVRRTGPSTFASRREQLTLAVKALSVLLPRDRNLVSWQCEGISLHEAAERLAISYDATQRATLRATERFQKAYRLLSAT